jgi:hypothetical protein
MRPVTPTPEDLVSFLHRYLTAAAAACVERMRRQSTVRQPHPVVGQFYSPQRPGDPRCGRCTQGQHVTLLPSPAPPASSRPPPPPATTPPPLPPPATTPPPPPPSPPPRFPQRTVLNAAIRMPDWQSRMPGPTPMLTRRAQDSSSKALQCLPHKRALAALTILLLRDTGTSRLEELHSSSIRSMPSHAPGHDRPAGRRPRVSNILFSKQPVRPTACQRYIFRLLPRPGRLQAAMIQATQTAQIPPPLLRKGI